MMIGMGTPMRSSRIERMTGLLAMNDWTRPSAGISAPVFPGAVAQAAAFGRGEAGRQRAEQHRGRKPESQMRRAATGGVGAGLEVVGDLRHAGLGIGGGKAGP